MPIVRDIWSEVLDLERRHLLPGMTFRQTATGAIIDLTRYTSIEVVEQYGGGFELRTHGYYERCAHTLGFYDDLDLLAEALDIHTPRAIEFVEPDPDDDDEDLYGDMDGD